VLQIQENPYLQYFVGLSSYKDEPLSTASCLPRSEKEWVKTFSHLLKRASSAALKVEGSGKQHNHLRLLRWFCSGFSGFCLRCIKKHTTGCISQLAGGGIIHLCISDYVQARNPVGG